MEMVTPDDKERLQAKLGALLAKRPEITQRIAEARALGDLKENADYHAAREDQGINEAEIRRLQERLAIVVVVDPESMVQGVVQVGCTVRICEVGDEEDEIIKIVGESSGNPMADPVEVTVGSPMGAALLKTEVGSVVRVKSPRRTIEYKVLEIIV